MLEAIGLAFQVNSLKCQSLLFLPGSRSHQIAWPYHYPEIAFIFFYVLSAVLCIAVGIMLTWNLWTISLGETTVESEDHDYYRKVARDRGEVRPVQRDLFAFD
jgi:hypothetical protein